MSPARIALTLVAAAALLPSALRAQRRPEPPAPRCDPQGRGVPPRHWIGCAADEGPGRGLTGGERLLLGVPVDLNRAAAGELALVPGLSPRLAAEVVADRERRGPFREVGELARVRGVGPVRLARARPHLAVEPSEPLRGPGDGGGG